MVRGSTRWRISRQERTASKWKRLDFKKLVRPDVTLQDALVIDLEMAVGSVSETVRVEASTVRDAGSLHTPILSSSPVPIAIRHTDNESHGSPQFRSACGNPSSNSDRRSSLDTHQ